MKEQNRLQTNLERHKAQGTQNRYAFEWYVQDADAFYWKMAKERIAGEVDRLNSRIKKTTALAVTSTVVALAALAISAFVLLCK